MKKKLALISIILVIAGTASAVTTIDPNFLQLDDDNPLTFGQDNDFNLSYDSGNTQLLLEQSNGDDVFQVNTGGVFQILNRNLDMGTNDITNVGNVDGVDVDNHNTRHEDGGSDEINVGGLSGQLSDAQQLNIQEGGSNVGLFDTLNFAENVNVTDAGSGVIKINSSGGGGGTAFNVSDDGVVATQNPSELNFDTNLRALNIVNQYNDYDGFEDGDYTSNPSWTVTDNRLADLTVSSNFAYDGTYSLRTHSTSNNENPDGRIAYNGSTLTGNSNVTYNWYFDTIDASLSVDKIEYKIDDPETGAYIQVEMQDDYDAGNGVRIQDADGNTNFTSFGPAKPFTEDNWYNVTLEWNNLQNKVTATAENSTHSYTATATLDSIDITELYRRQMVHKQGYEFNEYDVYWDNINYDHTEEETGRSDLSVVQGPGSGLNADTLDGFEGSTLDNRFDISDSGSVSVQNPTDIDFLDNLGVINMLRDGFEDGDHTNDVSWTEYQTSSCGGVQSSKANVGSYSMKIDPYDDGDCSYDDLAVYQYQRSSGTVSGYTFDTDIWLSNPAYGSDAYYGVSAESGTNLSSSNYAVYIKAESFDNINETIVVNDASGNQLKSVEIGGASELKTGEWGELQLDFINSTYVEAGIDGDNDGAPEVTKGVSVPEANREYVNFEAGDLTYVTSVDTYFDEVGYEKANGAKVEIEDGSGSGLDADTVDGKDLGRSRVHTASGNLSYDPTSSDYEKILMDSTSAQEINLTNAATISGETVTIKDSQGNAGSTTKKVITQGSTSIDGSSSYSLSSNYGAVTLFSDGSQWFIESTH